MEQLKSQQLRPIPPTAEGKIDRITGPLLRLLLATITVLVVAVPATALIRGHGTPAPASPPVLGPFVDDHVTLASRAAFADDTLGVVGHEPTAQVRCGNQGCGNEPGSTAGSATTTSTLPTTTTTTASADLPATATATIATTTTTLPPEPEDVPFGDTLFGNGWEASLGADIPDAAEWEVVHVNNTNPGASDDNAGSADRPLVTVQEGLQRARQAKTNGFNARVLVHPGTYRESLTIAAESEIVEQPILRLEAVEPGTAVISGSEVWTGWEQTVGSDISYHTWPYDWGLAPIPSVLESQVPEDIVRRLEMVFVDGIHLEQVLSYAELHPGSFFVSEPEDRLYVHPSGPPDLNLRFVEVAVRHDLLRVNGVHNFVLDGLVFEHANQPFYAPTAQVANSRNVEVAKITLRWNNWTGLGVWNTSNVTLHDSSAIHNGGAGMDLGKVSRARFEEVETAQNNWRGASGGYTGWSVAGIKAGSMHDVFFVGHRSESNATRGMWLDTNNESVLIDAPRWCHNKTGGFFVEATQGPIVVNDAVICNNHNAGVLSGNATNFALFDSTICNNSGTQILISGEPERTFKDPSTGEIFSIPPARDWTISRTTILDDYGKGPLIQTWAGQSGDEFLSTLASDHNTWWNASVPQPFWLGWPTTADFNSWQKVTDQDSNSTYTDPGVIAGC